MSLPAIGSFAPAFTLPTDAGEPFSLRAHRGHPVVLFFYPEDETEGCTIENIEFTALAPDFAALGVAVAGISPDTVETHCKFRDRHGLGLPLVADPKRKAIEAYGVWGPKKTFGIDYTGVSRTTFLIDARGRIAQVWPIRRIKGHAAEVLEAARELVAAGGPATAKRSRPTVR